MIGTRWATLALAVALSVPAAAWSVEPSAAIQARLDSRLSEGEMRDLAVIAQEDSVPLIEANESLSWQNEVAVAATGIEDAYPASYAGAEITSTTPPQVQVRFKSTVPDDVMSFFASVPGSVVITLVGDEKLSQSEVGLLVQEAHQTALSAGEFSTMASEFDSISEMVFISATPSQESKATLSELTAAVESKLRSSRLPNANVRINEGPSATDDSRYGGGWLENSSSNGTLACTAGFNVTNSSGSQTGIATAGHCSNSLTHENVSGNAEYPIAFKDDYVGTYGDFQWGTTTDSEPDDFYYNTGVRRDVSSIASPLVNQRLCLFGQKTKAHCAEVENNNICSTTSAGTACNLTRMKNDLAEGGDSGGPWYYGNTAYGFHKGSVSTALGTRDVFSKATLIDEAMNVYIRQ